MAANGEGASTDSAVIANILHAVQEGLQLQLTDNLESVRCVPGDIHQMTQDYIEFQVGLRRNAESTRKEIQLLTALKCTMDEKGRSPIGTHRGSL